METEAAVGVANDTMGLVGLRQRRRPTPTPEVTRPLTRAIPDEGGGGEEGEEGEERDTEVLLHRQDPPNRAGGRGRPQLVPPPSPPPPRRVFVPRRQLPPQPVPQPLQQQQQHHQPYAPWKWSQWYCVVSALLAILAIVTPPSSLSSSSSSASSSSSGMAMTRTGGVFFDFSNTNTNTNNNNNHPTKDWPMEQGSKGTATTSVYKKQNQHQQQQLLLQATEQQQHQQQQASNLASSSSTTSSSSTSSSTSSSSQGSSTPHHLDLMHSIQELWNYYITYPWLTLVDDQQQLQQQRLQLQDEEQKKANAIHPLLRWIVQPPWKEKQMTVSRPQSLWYRWMQYSIKYWMDPTLIHVTDSTIPDILDKILTSTPRLLAIANFLLSVTYLMHAAVAAWFLGPSSTPATTTTTTANNNNNNNNAMMMNWTTPSPATPATTMMATTTTSPASSPSSSAATAAAARERMGGFLVFKLLLISAVVTPDTLDLLILLSWYTLLSCLRSLDHLAHATTTYIASSGQTPQSGVLQLLALVLLVDIFAASCCVALFYQAGWGMVLLLTCDCALLATDVLQHMIRHGSNVLDHTHTMTIQQLETRQLELHNFVHNNNHHPLHHHHHHPTTTTATNPTPSQMPLHLQHPLERMVPSSQVQQRQNDGENDGENDYEQVEQPQGDPLPATREEQQDRDAEDEQQQEALEEIVEETETGEFVDLSEVDEDEFEHEQQQQQQQQQQQENPIMSPLDVQAESRQLDRQMEVLELAHSRRLNILDTAIFGLELVNHALTVAHFLHIWSLHGVQFTLIDGVLALHLHSAISSACKKVAQRRNISLIARDLHGMFPNASDVELRKASAAGDVCCICLGTMSTGGHVKKVHCGHLYHTHCLREVVERAQSIQAAKCPLCRASVVDGSPSNSYQNTAALVGPSPSPPSPANTGTNATNNTREGAGTGEQQQQQQQQPPVPQELALFRFSTEHILPAWLPVPAFSFEVVRRAPLMPTAGTGAPPSLENQRVPIPNQTATQTTTTTTTTTTRNALPFPLPDEAINQRQHSESPTVDGQPTFQDATTHLPQDASQGPPAPRSPPPPPAVPQQQSLLRQFLVMAGAIPMSPEEEARALAHLVDMFPQYDRSDLLRELRERGSAEAVVECILMGIFSGVPRGD